MLQAKTLPKVVCALSAWRGAGPESTLEKNELLILKGWKRKLSGKVLKAYNPVSKEKKELPENCQGKFCTHFMHTHPSLHNTYVLPLSPHSPGKFTTRSHTTKLFLSDIIEHVVQPLPCNAILYMKPDTFCEVKLQNTLVSLKVNCMQA